MPEMHAGEMNPAISQERLLERATTSCRHCGSEFSSRSGEEFCCHGCESVFHLIQGEGLDDYYRVRDLNPPTCPLPAQTSTESYEYCDDLELIAKTSPDGIRMKFYLEGLNCTACLWLLEKLPRFCSEAKSARVNMSSSTIEVERAEGATFAAIARAINRLGYRPHPVKDTESAEKARRREMRKDLIRIGIAGAATGNIMILAVSVYGGAEGLLARQFLWLSSLLAAPVMTYCAWPFYRSAWGAIRNKTLNLDVPIVAAILAGILMSLWGLVEGTDTIYFDSLSMLVLLLLSSRFWLKSIQRRHLDVSHLEDDLLVGTVTRLLDSGTKERVSSLSLKAGDRVEISGEMPIPADGQVASGTGLIDRSVLTGESDAFTLDAGARVEAGSRNLAGSWILKVEKSATESRLASILRDTEASARSKPAIVQFADTVSQWFIGVVMLIAAGLVIYFLASDPREGLSRALALVIVTCPCVFGMAIPLSTSLAIRAAARRGMIIKDADSLERLSSVDTFFFDKTGTLTEGELSLLKTDIVQGRFEDLAAALALEQDQPHPVARALVKSLSAEFRPQDHHAENVELIAEGGIKGFYKGQLHSLRPLGRAEDGPGATESNQIRARFGLYRGLTLLATFDLGDRIRRESQTLLNWAREKGHGVRLLSGDRGSVVEACAEVLGLAGHEVIPEATPETKSSILKQHGAQAAMIGDGANDAAALASAGVGIAVRGSMDISLKAADVYLMRPDLGAIPELFAIAARTQSAITRNLVFSAGFNFVAGYLAIAGHMTPMWAAILMPMSSLTVLASSLATGRGLMGSNPKPMGKTL
jgi:heavy metal translocating P-type ATPase